jgi:hypothetical protein
MHRARFIAGTVNRDIGTYHQVNSQKPPRRSRPELTGPAHHCLRCDHKWPVKEENPQGPARCPHCGLVTWRTGLGRRWRIHGLPINWALPNRDIAEIWHTTVDYASTYRHAHNLGPARWQRRGAGIPRCSVYRSTVQAERIKARDYFASHPDLIKAKAEVATC